jgi:hypothetical protein
MPVGASYPNAPHPPPSQILMVILILIHSYS